MPTIQQTPPITTPPDAKPDRPQVRVQADSLQIGNVTITFHRTLRIPDDGKQYPLPPSMGSFPLRRVEDYSDRVPAAWREHGGVFLPMFQREAMWLGFSGAAWRPTALKVAVGKVNALSGKPWSETLTASGRADTQDYMVIPDQPWLDGINAGSGQIKQFVAQPLGLGYTVEAQVTGKEEFGGLQLCVFEPKADKFPDTAPAPSLSSILRAQTGGCSGFGAGGVLWNGGTDQFDGGPLLASSYMAGSSALSMSAPKARSATPAAKSLRRAQLDAAAFAGQEMGLAAGGRMRQSIYPDTHGIDTWDQANRARVYVHLVNSQMWTEITGEPMPSTPVSAQAYSSHGYPWFDLYDEDRGDIAPSPELEAVKSVKEMDAEKGFSAQQDDSSVDVPEHLIHKTTPLASAKPADRHAVSDGRW